MHAAELADEIYRRRLYLTRRQYALYTDMARSELSEYLKYWQQLYKTKESNDSVTRTVPVTILVQLTAIRIHLKWEILLS